MKMNISPPNWSNPDAADAVNYSVKLNKLSGRTGRLFDAIPDIPYTRARETSKAGITGYLDDTMTGEEARRWASAENNVGVKLGEKCLGGRLVLIDDERGCLAPDGIVNLLSEGIVAIWTTPHGGKNYLLVVSEEVYRVLRKASNKLKDVTRVPGVDVEIKTKGHTIVPPSKLSHAGCSDAKLCNRTEVGDFTLVDDNGFDVSLRIPFTPVDDYTLIDVNSDPQPIERAMVRAFLSLLGADDVPCPCPDCLDSEDADTDIEGDEFEPDEKYVDVTRDLPDEDDERLDEVSAALLKVRPQIPEQAFEFTKDLWRGRTGPCEELREDTLEASGRGWAGVHEHVTLGVIFGMLRRAYVPKKRAVELTNVAYTQAVRDHPYLQSGESRKRWEEDREHRARELQAAVEAYDPVEFTHFLNRTDPRRTTREQSEHSRFTGSPSRVNRKRTELAVDSATGLIEPLQGETPEEMRVRLALGYDVDIPLEGIEDRFFRTTAPPRTAKCETPSEGMNGTGVSYATSDEVWEELAWMGHEMKESYFKRRVLPAVKETGMVRHALCWSRPNGGRHLYYSFVLSDPPDADEVRPDRKRDTHETDPEQSEEPEVELGADDPDGGSGPGPAILVRLSLPDIGPYNRPPRCPGNGTPTTVSSATSTDRPPPTAPL